jgi:2-oxo-4-hydroxy-4-carboxy-5-ureidoimidazoline decarboxylase
MTMAQVNAFDRESFVDKLGWVFEQSPWVAERTWDARPFANGQVLHEAMTKTMSDASEDEQLALLRAHPDLGTRARMSEVSVDEQAAAGLDRLTQSEFRELHHLNTQYKQKFGFPFLYAVKGGTKPDILAALAERLPRSHADEFQEALRQVTRIAQFRLEDAIDGTLS